MPGDDTCQRLITPFDTTGTPYRLIDHYPDGTTEPVSARRGHPTPRPRSGGRCAAGHESPWIRGSLP